MYMYIYIYLQTTAYIKTIDNMYNSVRLSACALIFSQHSLNFCFGLMVGGGVEYSA